MKLTPLEIEILKHRLEVPDCIAQSLDADTGDVDKVCKLLLASLATGELDDEQDYNLPLGRDILAECVEASTYCGAMTDESPAKYRAAQRAAESLAKKVGKLIGRELRAMTC